MKHKTNTKRAEHIAHKLAGEYWQQYGESDKAGAIQEAAEMMEIMPDASEDEIIRAVINQRAEYIGNATDRLIEGFTNAITLDIQNTLNGVLKAAESIGGIAPYYKQIVDENPKYKALQGAHASITREPAEDAPEDVKQLHNLFVDAWNLAREQWKQREYTKPENIQGHRLKQWLNPTDKATALFFSAAVPRPGDLPGQMSFVPDALNYDNSIPINMGKSGKTKNGKTPKQAILFLSYRTDPNTLQQFNKNWGDEYAGNFFLVFAASNLFLAANPEPGQHIKISLRQLWRAMPGKTSEPNEKQLKKLLNNVLQCLGTMVYTNSKQVAEQWDFPEYEEQYGQILPGKWVNKRATINGAIVDSYLEIYDISPFLKLALNMKQVQPVSTKVLEIKMSRTETTYRVFYYLLREILWMQNKNSKRAPLISYKDLYAAVGATDRKKKYTTRNISFKILEQWQAIGFIAGFRETPEDKTPGIEIDSRNTITD